MTPRSGAGPTSAIEARATIHCGGCPPDAAHDEALEERTALMVYKPIIKIWASEKRDDRKETNAKAAAESLMLMKDEQYT
eukprot:2024229-Heterocapsa_arctica.AAC.1